MLSWDTHLGCGNERKQEAGTSCHELDTELWGTVPESFIEGLPSGWAFNKIARTVLSAESYLYFLNIRDVTLVTLGLDNAGKSTVISVIINSEFYLDAHTVHG